MLVALPLACGPGLDGPVDAEDARRWARRHDPTLAKLELDAQRWLAELPSLPGDRFFCRETIAPPGTSPERATALRESLCRQQTAAWNAERHESEEELGVKLLNGAFQSYGVVGIALTLSSPEGVEWADHRGLWALSDQQPFVAAPEGVADGTGKLGWGQVDLRIEALQPPVDGPPAAGPDGPADLRWVIERTIPARRREADAEVRVLLLADGTPDAAFVQAAVGAIGE